MSTPKPDNPPAFPGVVTEMQYDKYTEQNFPCVYSAGGMTLRDWFAGQALAGILTRNCAAATINETAAEWAYKIADAMLAARAKEGTQ